MRVLYLVGFLTSALFWLSGCNPEDLEASIPGYIEIDSFSISYPNAAETGLGNHKITEAWVYVNDDLHSVTPLPGIVPIPQVGPNQKLTIGPGIRQNGIAATRDEYTFYQRFEVPSLQIVPDSVIKVEPSTQYVPGISFSYVEAFESSTILLDSVFPSDVSIEKVSLGANTPAFGRFISKVELNEDKPELKLASSNLFPLPLAGAPVYMELDYKCNAEFIVGLIVREATGIPVDAPVIWIQPTDRETGVPEWNKMYIYLTPYVSPELDAIEFGFTLNAVHDATNTTSEFYFDNIKIVHQ